MVASLAALSQEGLDCVSALCTLVRQARESPDFLRNPELLDHALHAMALVADNTAALVAQQAADAGVTQGSRPAGRLRFRNLSLPVNLVKDSATEWHTVGRRRVLKTRHFQRWMRSTELTDDALCRAVRDMAAGLLDADLGDGVVKKRVALPGRGKRGGARTLVATRKASLWFFVAGFAKNHKANVTPSELEALQALAGSLLGLAPRRLDALVQDGSLQEICHADPTQDFS